MTRAVIELSGDFSPLMRRASGLIEGCGYSPEANVIAFNYGGMGVIVEARKITINHAGDEATARLVMDWLREGMTGRREKGSNKRM